MCPDQRENDAPVPQADPGVIQGPRVAVVSQVKAGQEQGDAYAAPEHAQERGPKRDIVQL